MNWFRQTRQEWIHEMLRIYGFINRVHLQRKFRISKGQAQLDLREYQSSNRRIHYNPRKKRYQRR